MIALDEIIRDACEEDGDRTYRRYQTMQRFVIRGIADLTKFIIPTVISEILEVNDNLTVDLPDDLTFLNKVGIICNGTIVTLGVDNNISLSFIDPCQCETFEEANRAIDQCFECGNSNGNNVAFSNVYGNGSYYGEVYGIGGGYNYLGYYRYDKENRRLVLSSHFNRIKYPFLVVEYKHSGISKALTLVPEELREALITFARWKANSGTGVGNNMYEHWIVENHRLKKLYGASFGVKEWHAQFLQGIQTAPKR